MQVCVMLNSPMGTRKSIIRNARNAGMLGYIFEALEHKRVTVFRVNIDAAFNHDYLHSKGAQEIIDWLFENVNDERHKIVELRTSDKLTYEKFRDIIVSMEV